MPTDRGIDKVVAYFGNFVKLVEQRIKKQGKVKILDAGCGYGVAMMDFIKIFRNKIEMTGFNYSQKDGNTAIMKKYAVRKGIFTKKELEKIKLPKIVYCDASKRLPFKENSFDFIYGMASIYLYDDKIRFLEECNRILKKDGIARISPAFAPYPKEKGLPEQYRDFWEIWDKGKEVKIWNYCNRIKGVKAVWKNRGQGDKPMYIEISKQSKLDFKLKLIAAIDFNFLWNEWTGVKSIYTNQLKFKPHWKRK